MTKFILRWIINAIALFAAVSLVPGVNLQGSWTSIIWLALIFGLINAFLGPLLKLLTCPLIFLTLGLFTFVINAFLLLMTSGVAGGLVVDGFGSALLGSLIISVVSWLLSSFINDQGRIQSLDIELRSRHGDHWE